jgi:hypothetical protein
MTPTESALRLLRPGIRVRWPVQNDPKQPWLTQTSPLERTIGGVQGRQVVFSDRTYLTLPPDSQLRVGKTADGKADTLTLLAPPNPPMVLTIVVPAGFAPVLSWAALRDRCKAGAWVEIERNDKSPWMVGKCFWTRGVDVIDGRLNLLSDPGKGALDLPRENKGNMRFDGDRITWQEEVRDGWMSVPKTCHGRIRLRHDLPRPRA